MIHHLSVAAREPQHVASVLAEIIDGQSFPFGPFPGSYIVITGDHHGTAIEIYPLGLELVPGEESDAVHSATNPQPSAYTATHAAVSVNLSEDQIKRVAEREGWRAVTCTRGGFQVVEFWVENRLMIEFLTPEMARDYLRALTPERWNERLAKGPALK